MVAGSKAIGRSTKYSGDGSISIVGSELGRQVMSSRIFVDFAKKVKEIHETGMASEGTYRPAIIDMIQSLDSSIQVLNEPSRIECGAPDFIVIRSGNVIGHIEHKDICVKIRGMKGDNKKQQDRYKKALPNLIYTNCHDWNRYKDGKLIESASLEKDSKGLQSLLTNFLNHKPSPISNPKTLAKIMAGKTSLLRVALQEKLKKNDNGMKKISSQYDVFSRGMMWIKNKEEFVKFYAETITYVLFAARMNASDGNTFTRLNAGSSLPKNNPFLREMFHYISSRDLDKDIDWIIDDLVNLLSVCEIGKLVEEFTKSKGKEDPFLHFYETFLNAYDPERRRKNGVYYTPQQAVKFIVRSVDQILKDEFAITEGLADISTIPGKEYKNRKPMHRVRVLDPATGTGTFLVETVRHIAPTITRQAKSVWTEYVENHLIPRLHGFEILMAPYAMCFTKIDMVLKSIGYTPSENPSRLEIYLNDALDLGSENSKFLGFEWLTEEANLAGMIKDGDKPVMCVIGNPPYKGGLAAPKRDSLMNELLEEYKMEPGGDSKKLETTTIKQLNDLYVQFMRVSEYLVAESGEGVIGLITNSNYLKRKTFRGMRYHLQKTFDKIWIVNLHGEKGETCPDGSGDFNIFNITKGISIIIAVKTRKRGGTEDSMATVRYADIWGTREFKLQRLDEMNLSDSVFKTVPSQSSDPHFLMIGFNPKNYAKYERGFKLNEMIPLPETRSGIITGMDKFSLDMNKEGLWKRLSKIVDMSHEDAKNYLKPFLQDGNKVQNPDFWEKVRYDIEHIDRRHLAQTAYMPFDARWIHYTGKEKALIVRNRKRQMEFMKIIDNVAIVSTSCVNIGEHYCHVFCHKKFSDSVLLSKETGEGSHLFPLLSNKGGVEFEDGHRYNLDSVLYEKITKMIGVDPKEQKIASPRDVFNYIYGVLHCPQYRSVYKEFIKLDFPRIPWPSSPGEFWSVSEKGGLLIKLHLIDPKMEIVTKHPIPNEGDNIVSGREMPKFDCGKVYINSDQYFDNVPEDVWNFRIGGYRPAQDWLKERKGIKDEDGEDISLGYEDIRHYEKILNILSKTQQIMKTIQMDLPSG